MHEIISSNNVNYIIVILLFFFPLNIQEQIEVVKPVVFTGVSNLACISDFDHKDVQIDSFPGANVLHISKVLQKRTPNPNVQKGVLYLGINNKEQLFDRTVKKQLQDLLRIVEEMFPNVIIYTPFINFSVLLPDLQQKPP